MSLQRLLAYRLVYVATPYSKYAGGIEKAFEDACAITGVLVENGIKPFSPIAHSHSICKHSGLEPLSHDIWLAVDEPLMEAADALLIVRLDGFDDSFGVNYERDVFFAAGKDIFELDPVTLDVTQLSGVRV